MLEVFLPLLYLITPFLLLIFIIIIIPTNKKKSYTTNKKNNTDTDKKFEKIYSNMLKQLDLKHLEELKKNAIIENNKNAKEIKLMVCSIVGAFLIMWILSFFSIAFFTIASVFVFAVIIVVIAMPYINKKYNRENKKSDIELYVEQYKNIIIPEFLNQFEEKINYMPNEKIDKTIYNEAEFEKYDTYDSEDVMKMDLNNGFNVIMSDLKTCNTTTDDNGNTHYHELFKGIFTIIEMPKTFNEILYLKKDKKYKRKNIIPKIEKIKLDSTDFENYFDIYSTNSLITMQLLTSDIMEFFIDFQNSTGIDFELTLKNSRIYIRFFSGNIFEMPNLTESFLDKAKLKKYYEILNFTLEFTYKITNLLNNTEY